MLGNLGLAWLELGDPARAMSYLRQSLELARAIGNRNGEGVALVKAGRRRAARDDLAEARRQYWRGPRHPARDRRARVCGQRPRSRWPT